MQNDPFVKKGVFLTISWCNNGTTDQLLEMALFIYNLTTMISKTDFPEWQYQPFWLDKEDIKKPKEVIQQFFETYSLPVCRQQLWEMLTGFMNSDMADDMDKNDRGDLLFFYQGLGELVEAANVLSLRPQKEIING